MSITNKIVGSNSSQNESPLKTAQRDKIVRAAEEAFGASGAKKTNMQDIADLAGVSIATVYNYFPGKKQLVLGFSKFFLDRQLQMMREYSKKLGSSPDDRLLGVVTGILEFTLLTMRLKPRIYEVAIATWDDTMAAANKFRRSPRRTEIFSLKSYRMGSTRAFIGSSTQPTKPGLSSWSSALS